MKHKIEKFLVIGAIAMALVAGIIFGYIFIDGYRASEVARRTSEELADQIGSAEAKPLSRNGASADTLSTIEIDGQNYIGLLSIPSLSIELPVNSETSEANMKNSPCLYRGSFSGPMVITAHNYNSHFGGISKLEKGEAVVLTDADGLEHFYIVELVTVLLSTDVDLMEKSSFDLSLFTCTKSRTERITVRCSEVGV